MAKRLENAGAVDMKTGLYSNIRAKRERIRRERAEGRPVERMRAAGSAGAPTAAAFKRSAQTAKRKGK